MLLGILYDGFVTITVDDHEKSRQVIATLTGKYPILLQPSETELSDLLWSEIMVYTESVCESISLGFDKELSKVSRLQLVFNKKLGHLNDCVINYKTSESGFMNNLCLVVYKQRKIAFTAPRSMLELSEVEIRCVHVVGDKSYEVSLNSKTGILIIARVNSDGGLGNSRKFDLNLVDSPL